MSSYGSVSRPSHGLMIAAAAISTAATVPPMTLPLRFLGVLTILPHTSDELLMLATVTPPVEVPLHQQAEHAHDDAAQGGELVGRQPEHKCARPASVRPNLAGCHADRVNVP